MSAAKVRESFGEVLNRVGFGRERVLIERHGRPVAALISVEDFALLQALEDRLDVEAAQAALAEPGTVTLEELRARLAR